MLVQLINRYLTQQTEKSWRLHKQGKDFTFFYPIHTGCGVHPVFCLAEESSLPWGIAARV